MKNVQNTTFGKDSIWFAIIGIIVALTGIIAIAMPVAAGVTIASVIGGCFIGVGLIQLYHAVGIPQWSEKLWYVVSALLYTVGGILILAEPFVGVLTITALMISIMMLNGISRMIFAFSNRNTLSSWGWVAVGGLISTAIATYFFSLMNDADFSLSILGIFVGVSFIFEGISFIFIGSEVKIAASE